MSDITATKRARLGPSRPAMENVLGPNQRDNILQPLWSTKGMIWPYTPTVSFGGVANYGNWHFTHSNFQLWQYQNSAPLDIQVSGVFTAQTNDEGRYLLAVLRFLRASQMIEFGIGAAQRGVAGTPPPVLRFNYLGEHMINNVPVVLQTFNYVLEDNVDYVEVKMPDAPLRGIGDIIRQGLVNSVFGDAVVTQDNRTYVPTKMTITTNLVVQQNTRNVRENFDLEKFKRGDLINRGFI